MGGGRNGGRELASDPESQMMVLYIQLQLYCANAELSLHNATRLQEEESEPKKKI